MKTAGNLLSTLFDEQFVIKAKGYSKLHNSWEIITARNGIPAAAAHSRIKELDKGILLIETDHPGWKQILQTKQSELLNDYRRSFPELDISGISLMLGKSEKIAGEKPENKKEPPDELAGTAPNKLPPEELYNAIKDVAFREKLIKLGQNIAEAEKKIAV